MTDAELQAIRERCACDREALEGTYRYIEDDDRCAPTADRDMLNIKDREALLDEVARLREENARLKAGLVKFGKHFTDDDDEPCRCVYYSATDECWYVDDSKACSCGLDAALKGA
jgi:hypothetical protein